MSSKYENLVAKGMDIGIVKKITSPLVYVEGLPKAHMDEVVFFENGFQGIVRALGREFCEIMLLSSSPVSVGSRCVRSDELIRVAVGEDLLGKMVNPLGVSLLTGEVGTRSGEYRYIDNKPPLVTQRSRISQPLITGVPQVDLLTPLGKGQRELVIGDRNVGKTSFLQQVLLTQSKQGTVCIYAAVGKRIQSIKKVEQFIEDKNISNNCLVVASLASDPSALIYLTPYTAITYAEYFRDLGRDVLIIFDDLTTHAKFYREISLIAKTMPGRDSYPGDVFHMHAKLLERAGNFMLKDGKTAAISCMPVAETVGTDLSGYIQTNLMSITDGHLLFDGELFKKGKRPAINFYASVTRVGRQTQDTLRWGIHRELSSFFVLNQKTERFIHFGAEINEGIRSTLQMSEKLDKFFSANFMDTLDLNVQILIFSMIWSGFVTEKIPGYIFDFTRKSQNTYLANTNFKELVDRTIRDSGDLNSLLSAISLKSKEIFGHLA